MTHPTTILYCFTRIMFEVFQRIVEYRIWRINLNKCNETKDAKPVVVDVVLLRPLPPFDAIEGTAVGSPVVGRSAP